MITVAELIGRLKELPPDHRVVVSGYEGGVDDLVIIEPVLLKLDVNDRWYYGSHQTVGELHPEADGGDVPAVYLHSASH